MGRGDEKREHQEGRTTHKSKSIKKRMYHQKRRGQGYSRTSRGRSGNYAGSGYSGGNWNRKLSENISGFLCTCNMNEKDCIKEAFNILNEYVQDEDFPQENSEGASDTAAFSSCQDVPVSKNENEDKMETDESPHEGDRADKEEAEEDIEAALKAEIKELKSNVVRHKFFSVDTGVPNLIFIRSTVKDPSQLAHRILSDIVAKKQKKSRFLLRLIPIEITCRAQMDQIEGVCRKIFPKYFGVDFKSFQILFKSRYNNNIDRGEVIKLLADIVCEINPLSVVDLTNPNYSILVEVIKGIVCIGVVTDFNSFKKFNIHEAGGCGQSEQNLESKPAGDAVQNP